MKLIGVDIGTTSCKVVLFDPDGNLLGMAGREYAVDFPAENRAEQDGEQVWMLVQEAVTEVITKTGERRITAISLSCHGEAVTAVDEQGNALRSFILGMDTRTAEENRLLEALHGADRLFQMTGMPVHTINTLPKLLWIKNHQPELWKSAAAFRLVEDFLVQKMTGRAVISRCLASRTQLFDLQSDRWSEEILDGLQLDLERLSEVAPSGEAVGEMKADLAEKLGFANRPLVVSGGHDQACGALGVGLVKPGLSSVSTGTAEVIEVAMANPALAEPLRRGNISVYAHTAPGLFLAMTLNHSGGMSLRWFRDTFCAEEKAKAEASGADAYDLILSDVKPQPTGLLVMPHFSGSGTPNFDIHSRGAILGMTFATRKTDLAKAILEGLTYELRLNLEVLQQGGVQIDELRAIGGGAKSKLWLQIKADITGVPVVAPRITEAAAWGAALLAGSGAGIYSDVKVAAERLLRIDQRYFPDVSKTEEYNRLYLLYRQLYAATRDIHHRL